LVITSHPPWAAQSRV